MFIFFPFSKRCSWFNFKQHIPSTLPSLGVAPSWAIGLNSYFKSLSSGWSPFYLIFLPLTRSGPYLWLHRELKISSYCYYLYVMKYVFDVDYSVFAHLYWIFLFSYPCSITHTNTFFFLSSLFIQAWRLNTWTWHKLPMYVDPLTESWSIYSPWLI